MDICGYWLLKQAVMKPPLRCSPSPERMPVQYMTSPGKSYTLRRIHTRNTAACIRHSRNGNIRTFCRVSPGTFWKTEGVCTAVKKISSRKLRNGSATETMNCLSESVNTLLINSPEGIDALAVTQGPGLAPALWVGVTFARVLSVLWNIPIIPVNHLEGHIVSALSDGNRCFRADYPVLTLIVSGGHTELVYSEKPGTYIKVGSTLDDAAGEAFDKTARLLGLPYPGGPAIQRSAENARKKKLTPPAPLPRPMLRDKSLNFSYAGLKTAVRTLTEKTKILSEDERSAVAMEFENAVVETLTEKTKIGIEQYAPKTVAVGGGVSANAHLRREMKALVEKYPGMRLCLPSVAQATDNAVMIALAAYTHRNDTADPETLRALPNLSFPAQ